MTKSMMTPGLALALALFSAGAAVAQVTAINGAATYSHEYNDDKTAITTIVNNYPSLISLGEQKVNNNGAAGGYAVRDVWRFSDDAGTSAYQFSNDDFFDVSMTLTLTGNVSPRKEAGYLFDTKGGQGQFIVNTDAHEVVMFGGPFPFYAFPRTFNAGDTITLGMTYFRDTDGKRKIIYHAGPLNSPPLTFNNLEQGIIDGTKLGGYLQVPIDSANAMNGAAVTFRNITITPVTGNTVSGTLTFEGIAATAPNQNVTFIFRPTDGGASFTRRVSVPASGAFSVANIPVGTFNTRIKGDKYLAQVVPIDTTGGPTSGIVSTQRAGDSNNDNSVDSSDFTALIGAYNSDITIAGSGYDPNADFNGDGSVDSSDFTLLIGEFNVVGDN